MDQDRKNDNPFHEGADEFESHRAVNEENYNRGSWSDVMNGGSSVEYRTPVRPKPKKPRKQRSAWQKIGIGFLVFSILMVLTSIISSIVDDVPEEERMTEDRAGFRETENKTIEYNGYRFSIPLYFKETTEEDDDSISFEADAEEDVFLCIWIRDVDEEVIGSLKDKDRKLKEIAMLDEYSNRQKNRISNLDSWSDLHCRNIEATQVDGHEAFIMEYDATLDYKPSHGVFYLIANAEKNTVLTVFYNQEINTRINYGKDVTKIIKSIKCS